MLDVTKLMSDLAHQRPVFHSEADFQHALAWRMHAERRTARIRLEWPVEWSDSEERIYVDLYLPTRKVAVELKYLTRKLDLEREGERFALRNQGAQDIRRYDFLKDIERLERLSERTDVRTGFAILLTNDPTYWKPPRREGTVDAEFRLHEGRTVTGTMEWSEEASFGTKRGRDVPIHLSGSYALEWQDYGDEGDGDYQRFRYLAIRIGSSSNLGEQQ